MSAQPKRAPERHDGSEPDRPRLRPHARVRLSTPADTPASPEVTKLQDRVSRAFSRAPDRAGRTADLLLKLLTVAAACVCVGEALALNAPVLSRLLG